MKEIGLWTMIWTVSVITGMGVAQTSQLCPSHTEISPCSCTLKKSGLDIICEYTDLSHISNVMSSLKGRTNTVIFYLRLRHNNLPKLQPYVFLGLDIRHLTIHNSSLAKLEESSLSSVGSGLTQLDLSQNALASTPSSALKELHHLLILNLNRNKIKAIHKNAFDGLDTLEILSLYENEISIIEEDAFTGLHDRKLRRLNLGGNELTKVPTQALRTLNMLKKLEMQENRIASIQEGDFEENLQYLRLGDNNLHSVPSDALRRLHRLRHLDLKANNITALSEDAFTGYGDSITFLNLQKNLGDVSFFLFPRIKILPPVVFENLNSLETLNLQNNKLVHIPEEVTENIVDTLRHIDITDNPLVCDCELRWYSIWLGNLRDKDDERMSRKHTVCTMLSENREYSVQNIPLERMGCVGKNAGRTSSMGTCHVYTDTMLRLLIVAVAML
ncbi:slit homolog 2 protein isoform X3 [Apis laboriosa]|uniref:slit homolog 2 protein isoform X3 n=1 Tax=Apis laboriosa TaxID=183418 RepID=UPI001CC686AD|nr:slit homolog 2 protein isoform X3 [Apis laboriosa]